MSTTKAKAIKSEKAARIQLLKCSARLSDILKNPEIPVQELFDELEIFEKRIESLEKKQ